MKKGFAAGALGLLLSLLLSLSVGAEGTAEGGEWFSAIDTEGIRLWFEAEVLPHLVTVLTVLGVAMVELIPAVRSLIKAKAAFAKVASDVDAYNQSKIEYDLRVEEREKAFEERIEKMQEEHNEMVARLNETVNTYKESLAESEERLANILRIVETRASKVERMVYLGMSNSCELVANGAARKIAEIEEEPDIPAEEACYYE